MNTSASATGLVGFCRWIVLALERVPVALPVLILRLAVALTFWRAGQAKLPFGNDTVIALFREEYRLPLLPPETAAYLATSVELACPVLLVLGFLTRPAAAVLFVQTLVIEYVYPMDYPEHLLWAAPLLYLVLRGPGNWSFDARIRDSIGGGA